MARTYTKIPELKEIVLERKGQGAANRIISESLGLSRRQIMELVTREQRYKRKIAECYEIP